MLQLNAGVRSRRLKTDEACGTFMTMSTLTKADVLSLSVSERIQLVEDIWDTVAEVPEEVGLSDEQKAELDRRLDAYHRNPDEGSPWGMVRERIRSRR
jgi:putative addiction module component (TIGR02574 family)